MEALCIAGLMITIAVRINMTESDPTHFVGVLAVFAAAAFYLLPSANKMSEYLASNHSQRRRDSQDRRGVHEDPRPGD